MRGSCYSGAKEPLYRSSYHGCSQEIVARWFEGRKKKWYSLGWQESLVEKILLEKVILEKILLEKVIVEKIRFSQINDPRKTRSGSEECRKKRPGTQERWSQIRWTQIRWTQVIGETLEPSEEGRIEASLVGSQIGRAEERKRRHQGRFRSNEASSVSREESEPGGNRSRTADSSRSRARV